MRPALPWAASVFDNLGPISSGAEVGLSRLSAVEAISAETLEGTSNTYRHDLGSFYVFLPVVLGGKLKRYESTACPTGKVGRRYDRQSVGSSSVRGARTGRERTALASRGLAA